MQWKERLTLKEAAAAYGTSLPTMSRLVRRLGVRVEPNPRDRRSKIVKRTDLERAMGVQTSRKNKIQELHSFEAEERRRRTMEALDRLRAGREEMQREMERLGIKPIPSLLALDFVRGEITLEELDEKLADLR